MIRAGDVEQRWVEVDGRPEFLAALADEWAWLVVEEVEVG